MNGWINGLIFNLLMLNIRSVKTQADLLDEDEVVLTVSTSVDFILIPEKTKAAKVQIIMILCFN